MKNSFFSRFTPKEPKFFPLLKQLSEILVASSELLVESLKKEPVIINRSRIWNVKEISLPI